jgi:hypothetical protein
MRRKEILTISILAGAVVLLFLYLYVFNIYEVQFEITRRFLYADNQSMTKIEAVPLNSFGWKAPFRFAPATFEIERGKNLIEIIKEDNSRGILIIRSKNDIGNISIIARSPKALLPSIIEISILPNTT